MTAAADITYCKRFTTSLAILCVLSISTPAQTVGTDQNPPAPLGKVPSPHQTLALQFTTKRAGGKEARASGL
jgi:hypothetical protein